MTKRESKGRDPSAAASKTANQTRQNPQLTRWIQKVRALPAVREDLIQRVKAEIAAEKYETPERLEISAERLLKDLVER